MNRLQTSNRYANFFFKREMSIVNMKFFWTWFFSSWYWVAWLLWPFLHKFKCPQALTPQPAPGTPIAPTICWLTTNPPINPQTQSTNCAPVSCKLTDLLISRKNSNFGLFFAGYPICDNVAAHNAAGPSLAYPPGVDPAKCPGYPFQQCN